MSKLKTKTTTIKNCQQIPAKELFFTVGGNADWCSHSGNQYCEPSKTNKQKPKPKVKLTI